ncbi:PHD finger protein 24-like isoform X1 [Dermacentor albipictus]|uniref:PHD finger protein 24-like isoform X1 n=1 Tax=Dermacentor albipictus TaxID=60249 RepID=UPI0038FCFCE5
MSRPAGTSTSDVLYTNAERASLNERWSQPPGSHRRKFLNKFGSPLGRKRRRKHRDPAGDHSPGTTEPASSPDYLDYEQDLPIVRVGKPLCEVCHSHGHHPPHPKTLLEDMLKCRICGNSYHLRCLRSAGLPNQPRGALLDRHAWSCMKCETLELLLSDAELHSALDAVGMDAQEAAASALTWPCFLALHERLYAGTRDEQGSLPHGVVALLREDFARFDRDHDGSISWAQVLTRFALQVLRQRHTDKDLVSLLKPAEVRLLKEEFALRDTHNGGAISVADARRVVHEWRDHMALTTSVEFLVDRIRAASDHPDPDRHLGDVDRFVTWSRFLCVMALPVIAARPNTWGGPDYVAFLEDDHVGLLGSMRFPLDGVSESKSPAATSAESEDED